MACGGPRVCRLGLWVILLCAAGCPGDGGDETTATATGTDTATTSGTTSAATEVTGVDVTGVDSTATGTGGECMIDPALCTEPPASPPGEPVPSFPTVQGVSVAIDSMSDCPVARSIADAEILSLPDSYSALVFHPDDGAGGLPNQPGGFGLVVFTHGNLLDGNEYTDLMSTLASRGVIALSIVGDSPPNVAGRARKVRLLCVAEALLEENIAWVGSGELSGDYAFSGHSSGGLGTFLAAKQVLDDDLLPDHNLVGSLAIAPVPTASTDVLVTTERPFFLTIQGSGDGDSSGGAFSHFDTTQASGGAGGPVAGGPREALVWAYNVAHTAWGGVGLGGCEPTPKALALIEAYVGDFVGVAFYDNAAARETFFVADEPSPIVPPGVQSAPWPEFGSARVFGTSSERVSPMEGYEAWAVDRFENLDPTLSDSGLAVTVSTMEFQEAQDGGSPLFDNTHTTTVGAAVLTADPNGTFADSVSWDLSCEATEALARATSVTFRIGLERGFLDEVACTAEDFEIPAINLVLESDTAMAAVDATAFARIELPDVRNEEDPCAGPGTADGCRIWESLQATVRIPVAEFCGTGLVLEEATRLALEFSSAVADRALIIDDLEIRRVPGEPAAGCRCN